MLIAHRVMCHFEQSAVAVLLCILCWCVEPNRCRKSTGNERDPETNHHGALICVSGLLFRMSCDYRLLVILVRSENLTESGVFVCAEGVVFVCNWGCGISSVAALVSLEFECVFGMFIGNILLIEPKMFLNL